MVTSGLGATGVVFSAGGEVTSRETSGLVLPGGVSRVDTRATNWVAIDVAMSSDRAASLSVTVAVSSTVFGSPFAVILLTMSSALSVESVSARINCAQAHAAQQLHVGIDPFLRELVALVGAADLLGRRPDEECHRRLVFRRCLQGHESADTDGDQRGHDDDPPVLAQGASKSAQVHVGPFSPERHVGDGRANSAGITNRRAVPLGRIGSILQRSGQLAGCGIVTVTPRILPALWPSGRRS